MSPDDQQVLHELANVLRRGELGHYLGPGVLSRFRYEAQTGRGRPRTQEEWRLLQQSLQDFRHAEDGDRVEQMPFAKRHEHPDSLERAPHGSDAQVFHSFNRRLNQYLEDDQLTEMTQERMGTDASRPQSDRPPSVRESLESAYETHAVPSTSNG